MSVLKSLLSKKPVLFYIKTCKLILTKMNVTTKHYYQNNYSKYAVKMRVFDVFNILCNKRLKLSSKS